MDFNCKGFRCWRFKPELSCHLSMWGLLTPKALFSLSSRWYVATVTSCAVVPCHHLVSTFGDEQLEVLYAQMDTGIKYVGNV